jgi:hypothetical protein
MTDRFHNVYQTLLIEIIDEGIRQHEFKEDADPALVSSMVWGSIDGICLHYSVIGESYPFQKQIRALEEMVLMYLEKRGMS